MRSPTLKLERPSKFSLLNLRRKVTQYPIAFAGGDLNISTSDTLVLKGEGFDNLYNITSYEWTQISGPEDLTIVSPNSAQTNIEDLAEGEYLFQLRVENSIGKYSLDTVLVNIFTFEGFSVHFSVDKLGLYAKFTNESGGTSWLWDFGDGITSILENPNHLYLEEGNYTVELTVDSSTSGSELINIYEGMQPLFGITINNIGDLYNEGGFNEIRNNFVKSMGFIYQSYTSGSEPHFMNAHSKIGYPTTTDVPNVGMRANLDEIFHYTGLTSGAYNLQKKYNETEVDFFPTLVNYVKSSGQVFIYIINVCHGTLNDAIYYIEYLKAENIPFVIMYDNESSIGFTSSTPGETQTSAEYLTKVDIFWTYISANYPDLKQTINTAYQSTPNWDSDAVAAYAISKNIPCFSQYFWMGDNQGAPNSENVIDDYFEQAIYHLINSVEVGNNSLYGEILPRIASYYITYGGLKMHIGQYGISLQRSGWIAQTILHGIMIWNEIFEFLKFNDSVGINFLRSGTFFNEDVTAVSKLDNTDNGWTIDPVFSVVDGSKLWVKRVPGMAYQLLKDLPSFDGNPIFIEVDRTNFPTLFDVIAYQISNRVLIYIYNYGEAKTVDFTFDSIQFTENGSVKSLYSDELYGSIGFNVSHSHFAQNGFNPDLQKTNVHLFDGMESMENLTIRKASITCIEVVQNIDLIELTF